MKLEELAQLQARRLLRAIEEFTEAKDWREKLARLKEILIYERELSGTIERLENIAAQAFREQTGLRAAGRIWKRIDAKKSVPPPSHET